MIFGIHSNIVSVPQMFHAGDAVKGLDAHTHNIDTTKLHDMLDQNMNQRPSSKTHYNRKLTSQAKRCVTSFELIGVIILLGWRA